MKKPNFYELLEITDKASSTEINAAFTRLSKKYQSAVPGMTREDCDIKLKVVQQAFEVLSNEVYRSSYDAKLRGDSDAAPVRVEQKAELLSAANGWTPLRMLLTIIASLMTIGLVIQLGSIIFAYRQAHMIMEGNGEFNGLSSKSQEKVMLQEFYQETGIRAASIEEMKLLQAEEQKKSEAQREADNQRRLNENKEREYQSFVEDSRQVGQQVTNERLMAEERAAREAEEKKYRLEQEEQQRKEQERMRIENEKNKYRSAISNGSSSSYSPGYSSNNDSDAE